MHDLIVDVEAVDECMLPEYAALSLAQYGDCAVSRIPHLRWKFLANPAGSAKAVHVRRFGELIARVVAQPHRFHTPAGEQNAAYIVDLVVHPGHRGMYVLLALLDGFKRLRTHFDFVYITPNAAGAAVWKNFVKLPERFDLDILIVPLRPGTLLGRMQSRLPSILVSCFDLITRSVGHAAAALAARSNRIRITRSWPSDRDFAELFALPPACDIGGVRNEAFLRWRFADSPEFHYDIDFIYRTDRLAGYLVTRRTTYGGYDTSFIVDAYSCNLLEARDWKTIIRRRLAADFRPSGPELMMLLGNTSNGALAQLAAFPFIRVPVRLRPQKAPLFADRLTAVSGEFEKQRFSLTLADCDML